MNPLIDIEKLGQIPITEKLCDLFDRNSIGVKSHSGYTVFSDLVSKRELITVFEDGSIGIGAGSDLFNNAFEIVRYIDKYLNGGKSDIEHLLDDIHTSISIDIVPVDDTDNIMFGTIKRLAEKYK